MTVHPTVDHADFFAAYKRPQALPEHQCELERLAQLAHLDRQCFDLLDDLQRICHHGCSLSNADIGAIQAKLIILRINLNVRHGVNTPQLGVSWTDPQLAEGMGQR